MSLFISDIAANNQPQPVPLVTGCEHISFENIEEIPRGAVIYIESMAFVLRLSSTQRNALAMTVRERNALLLCPEDSDSMATLSALGGTMSEELRWMLQRRSLRFLEQFSEPTEKPIP